MNIEGGEKETHQGIKNFSFIKRFINSYHDFRANNSDEEYFHTKEVVISLLEANSYVIKPFNNGISFADGGVYSRRSDL